MSAKDKETGAIQSVKVKLAASMSKDSISEAAKKFSAHKEVKLKDQWENATKVVMCLPHVGGAVYEEGYVKDFKPDSSSFTLHSENSKVPPKEIEQKQIAWILSLEDFSNIPRYIQALTHEPQKDGLEGLQALRLKDGSQLFGQSQEADQTSKEGMWVKPVFNVDPLPGQVFVFNASIRDKKAMN